MKIFSHYRVKVTKTAAGLPHICHYVSNYGFISLISLAVQRYIALCKLIATNPTPMKKFLVTVLLALAGFLPAHSQLRLGISLDPQVSWLSSDRKRVEGDGSIGGVSFGLNVDRYFAKRYAFYTGVFYETIGGYLKYNLEDGYVISSKDQPVYEIAKGQSMKYRMQYISIPTGVKLKTNRIGYNSFYANLGFRTSFLTRSKGFGKGMDGEVLNDVMHAVNFGWQVGVGTEYSLGGDVDLIFGITYNNGIANTVDDSSLHINLNGVSFKVGVMF